MSDTKKLSLQKQQSYENFSNIIQWGRKNPVLFAEYMFGIRLMDYQKWVFMESWTKPYVIWLLCRAAGKTTLMVPFLMCKMLLIPGYRVYVAANSASQAIESFMKLEDIAMGRIASFPDATDIFYNELVSVRGNEKFKHAPNAHQFSLYNNSQLVTLTSNTDASRGKRGAVWYDEASWLDRDFLTAIDQFINVDSNFELRVKEELYKRPEQMPLQLIYTSSAGSVNKPFYEKYREYSKKMIAGDHNYFTCNLDAYTLLDYTTVDGKKIKSHLNRAQVEAQLETNPDAERELLNHFTSGGGRNAVVPEEVLVRNSRVRLPVFHNDTGKRKFILCYDPARNYDNSILSVFEIIDDPQNGYIIELVNVISMVDEDKEKKTPMNMLKQLDVLRQTMIRYNGPRAAEWENIELYIDSGAGGGGRSSIADHLMDDWTDPMGVEHRGIIDPIDPDYENERLTFRNAAPIVHLINPKKYKNQIFGAFAELATLNLIKFPMYDGYKDFLIFEDDSEEGFTRYDLSVEEKDALIQMNLAKSEMNYMVRVEHSASKSIGYELSREKRYTMHDDRAYTLALGAYALWEKRNKDLREKPKPVLGPMLQMHAPDPYGGKRKKR